MPNGITIPHPFKFEHPTDFVTEYERRAISRDLRSAVWSMTYGRCFYCGWMTNPWGTFTVDHIVPVAKGGTNDIRNLVPCCTRCNFSKGTKDLDEWAPRSVRQSDERFWFLSDDFRRNHGTEYLTAIDEWLIETYIDGWEDGGES